MQSQPEEVLEQKLTATEKLLWAGQPRQGLRLQFFDVILIPFFLVCIGICLLGAYIIISSGMPPLHGLVFLPFLTLGVYFLIARFVLDIRRRAETFYGVSSERILVITGVNGKDTRSLALDALPALRLAESANGAGVIAFADADPQVLTYLEAILPSAGRRLGLHFDVSDNAREVHELIVKARPDTE